MRFKTAVITVSGFILSSILFMALSAFTILSGVIYSHLLLKINFNTFTYLFTLIYFTGMPMGKVLGRIFGFHKKPSFFTMLMILIISITIPFIYYSSNLYLILTLRFIQGTSTFLMEMYSIEFSSFLALKERIVPSSIAIGGIPTGVALGGLVAVHINKVLLIAWPVASILIGSIFSYSLSGMKTNVRETVNFRNKRKSGFRNPLTWYMGIIWMSIAGFNLSLAVIIPLYLQLKNPGLINYSLGIFGYSGALFTFIGGIAAFILYSETKHNYALINLSIFSYAISFIGFALLIIFGIKQIALDIILISFEAMNVGIIYSIPKDIFGEENFANSTWEFSLIGSMGHILAPLILIPMAFSYGFNLVFIIYAMFPIIASLLFLKIKFNMSGSDSYYGIPKGYDQHLEK